MVERSAGLVVMTETPGMGLVAVLRERGRYNFEKMKPESYPGACQVTAHGKVEEGDSTYDHALYREVEEELGPDFAAELDFTSDVMLRVNTFDEYGDEARTVLKKQVLTFTTKLPLEVVKKIRLHPDGGGLRLVRRDEVAAIRDIREFEKGEGVTDRRVIAMFPDEKEAVEKAFAFAKFAPK